MISVVHTLQCLDYWFDTEQEVLDAMAPDERAEMYDHASWAASRSLNSPEAKLARDCLVEACIKRDNNCAA